LSWVLILALALVLVAFHLWTGPFVFSPSNPSLLFMLSHSSDSHLLTNVLSLVLVWLMAQRTGESEKRLLVVFLVSSLVPLFIPVLFGQPIIGASAGVYGMIGYMLPDFVGVVPLGVSYAALFPLILLEGCFMCKPWGKLFHIFSLTLGVVLHYAWDIHSIGLQKSALSMRLGTDEYSLMGLGYPSGYVEVQLPWEKG